MVANSLAEGLTPAGRGLVLKTSSVNSTSEFESLSLRQNREVGQRVESTDLKSVQYGFESRLPYQQMGA